MTGFRLLWVAGFLAAISLSCRGPSFEEERIELVTGAAFPRWLAGGNSHHFLFEAAANQLLDLRVQQRDLDVVVRLEDSAGRLLYEADNWSGKKSPEAVLAVTPASGRYVLAVEPLRSGEEGAFVLEVREVRPARPEDRLCAATAAAFARAELRHMEGDFSAAAVSYREALRGLEKCGTPAQQAQAEWALGTALYNTGRLHEAATVLDNAMARYHRLGDRRREALAANKLGSTWRSLGQPGRALATHERALQLYREENDLQGEASTLSNLGRIFQSTGELHRAIEHYEAALALFRLDDTEAEESEAQVLQNLGTLYALIGHDEEALDFLQQALDRLSKGEVSERTSVLVDFGWVQYLVGHYGEALERYREALALAEQSGDLLSQASILDRQGTALRALRRHGEAEQSYLRSLAASRQTGSPLGEGHTLANLGWLDLEAGDPVRARSRLRQAYELLEASGDPNGQVYALVGLSQAERRLGNLQAARRPAEAALRLVEGLRTGLQGERSRGHFLATRYSAYEELAGLLMELDRQEPEAGHARAALELAERGRARNLVENIAGRPSGTTVKAEPAEGNQRALLNEIEHLEAQRRSIAARNPGDPRLAGIDAALRARSLELDRRAAPPAPPAAFATLPEMQALADEDTLVVIYLLAEPESYAWTVDAATVVSHRLPGRERIEKLAKRVAEALPRGHEVAAQKTAEHAAAELSKAVLAPLAQRLAGRRRLLILADGALHLVPLGALPVSAERPGEAAQPLLLQHEVTMLPSVTMLTSQRRRLAGRPPAPGRVAVLFDPVFSPDDPRLSARSGSPDPESRSGEIGLDQRDRLEYTAEEAQAILRLVPEGQALSATGLEANLNLVRSGALRRYRILHFATHGMLHPVLPERSGLLLSLFDPQGRRREGFLSAPDVAALDLPAELAVLSACKTGLGREMRGEGLVGLTQAFFRAGVRGVVVSHWNVDDRATAALMARFYHNLLAEGMAPPAALREAQLALRNEQKWRFPYYWAGFTFHGDSSPAARALGRK